MLRSVDMAVSLRSQSLAPHQLVLHREYGLDTHYRQLFKVNLREPTDSILRKTRTRLVRGSECKKPKLVHPQVPFGLARGSEREDRSCYSRRSGSFRKASVYSNPFVGDENGDSGKRMRYDQPLNEKVMSAKGSKLREQFTSPGRPRIRIH